MEQEQKGIQLQARFKVAHKDYSDKPFFYTTDLNIVKQLGLTSVEYFMFAHKKGKILVEGEEKEIIDVKITFYENTQDNKNYGINLLGTGEQYPYNVDVLIII